MCRLAHVWVFLSTHWSLSGFMRLCYSSVVYFEISNLMSPHLFFFFPKSNSVIWSILYFQRNSIILLCVIHFFLCLLGICILPSRNYLTHLLTCTLKFSLKNSPFLFIFPHTQGNHYEVIPSLHLPTAWVLAPGFFHQYSLSPFFSLFSACFIDLSTFV